MQPGLQRIPDLDDGPPPVVPEPGKAGQSPETTQAGAPGPSVAAFADDDAAPMRAGSSDQRAVHGMGAIEGPRRYGLPAHSPARAHNDMLPPSAATPGAPGTPGLASEMPSEPANHRSKPLPQNPEPSECWYRDDECSFGQHH